MDLCGVHPFLLTAVATQSSVIESYVYVLSCLLSYPLNSSRFSHLWLDIYIHVLVYIVSFMEL